MLDNFDCLTPLPFNEFSNKLVPNVPNSILRNLPFCSFVTFLIVLLIPFTNKKASSCDSTIITILSISLFEIIIVVVPDPNVFF